MQVAGQACLTSYMAALAVCIRCTSQQKRQHSAVTALQPHLKLCVAGRLGLLGRPSLREQGLRCCQSAQAAARWRAWPDPALTSCAVAT